MPKFDMIVQYSLNPSESAKFYETHLGAKTVATMPTFVMLNLHGAINIGLWKCEDVLPPASEPSVTNELVLNVETDEELQSTYDTWKAAGVSIIQEIAEMGFGKTFTATDPDGNRIRIVLPVQK